jgi:hypothetical protein
MRDHGTLTHPPVLGQWGSGESASHIPLFPQIFEKPFNIMLLSITPLFPQIFEKPFNIVLHSHLTLPTSVTLDAIAFSVTVHT